MKKLITIALIALTIVSCKKKREFKSEDDFRNWLKGKTFVSIGKDHAKIDANGAMVIPTGEVMFSFDKDGTIHYMDEYRHMDYDIHQRDGGYSVDYEFKDVYYQFRVTDKECELLSDAYDTNNEQPKQLTIGPEMEIK